MARNNRTMISFAGQHLEIFQMARRPLFQKALLDPRAGSGTPLIYPMPRAPLPSPAHLGRATMRCWVCSPRAVSPKGRPRTSQKQAGAEPGSPNLTDPPWNASAFEDSFQPPGGVPGAAGQLSGRERCCLSALSYGAGSLGSESLTLGSVGPTTRPQAIRLPSSSLDLIV